MTCHDRLTTACILFATVLPHAAATQSIRDSAGITIVTNQVPVWPSAKALRLGQAPNLVIGTVPEGPYLLDQVRTALRLSDGRIVIADGGSTELRFYDSEGTFIRTAGRAGEGPGDFRRFYSVTRLPGDTLAVIEPREVTYFSPDGQYQRTLPNPDWVPAFGGLVLALFPDGSRIVMTGIRPTPRTRGDRWVEATPVLLAGPANDPLVAIGTLKAYEFAMDESPGPPWLGAVAAFAGGLSAFYYGYPAEYSVRQYSAKGRLLRIVRREWDPRPITEADKDAHTKAWGERWVRTDGSEASNELADHRNDPFARTLPAFSQMLVDGHGRLWIREAHLADAAWAGQLNTMPVVPSTWSVFDSRGGWLCDVVMPARFLPRDIGRDYILGIELGTDDIQTVALYPLFGGGLSR